MEPLQQVNDYFEESKIHFLDHTENVPSELDYILGPNADLSSSGGDDVKVQTPLEGFYVFVPGQSDTITGIARTAHSTMNQRFNNILLRAGCHFVFWYDVGQCK